MEKFLPNSYFDQQFVKGLINLYEEIDVSGINIYFDVYFFR
jgi:hypothetical protein